MSCAEVARVRSVSPHSDMENKKQFSNLVLIQLILAAGGLGGTGAVMG